MIAKKNIIKVLILFLILHLFFWTLAPSISNINLPLDTIEALAWGSNLEWGFNKHPPFSAFAVEIFYTIFGSNDWAYYLLSQIFVVVSLIYVWKFSNEIFDEKIYSLLSVLTLSGIYYYNFTTPEFNVNVSQLPFWALTVYFFWKSINSNNRINWILFGIFSALGFLSKYLFIYILLAIFFYFILNIKIYKKFITNYLLSIAISLAILTPHFIWLFKNNFITIVYGLNRSSLTNTTWVDHLENPLVFIFKQILILIPFFIMIFILLKKFNFKFNLKNRKNLFLVSINLIPIILILFTSIVSGAKIRTMWMTPFYLFFGTLFIYLFQAQINIKKLKPFMIGFIFFFFLSPALYAYVSISKEDKRTDYPGKEIAIKTQYAWDQQFNTKINVVYGNEWNAGNLSYHLKSRPIWDGIVEREKLDQLKDYMCLDNVCVGSK